MVVGPDRQTPVIIRLPSSDLQPVWGEGGMITRGL